MAKRVLLAEDDPNIVESLIFLLERAGFDVVSGMNGQAALGATLVEGRPQGAGAPAVHPRVFQRDYLRPRPVLVISR